MPIPVNYIDGSSVLQSRTAFRSTAGVVSNHLLIDCALSLLKSPSPIQRNNNIQSYTTLEVFNDDA